MLFNSIFLKKGVKGVSIKKKRENNNKVSRIWFLKKATKNKKKIMVLKRVLVRVLEGVRGC